MPTSNSSSIGPDPIHIPKPVIQTMELRIEGTSPLIVSRFDEKAKEMMLAAMQTKTRKVKEPKDPEKEYQRRRYITPDGRDGFPAVGFKAAIIGGARQFDGITMTALKSQIYVRGEGPDMLVPIDGDISMREDTVRVGNGVADLRYRPMYWPWSCVLNIDFFPALLSPESVVALTLAGGFGGIGEWRPSAPKSLTGTYGRFTVKEVTT
jgi:hypothetical protein